MEDQTIIELFYARDENAVCEIKKKYGNYCRSIALGILENESDADECENDTYLGVWKSIPPNRPQDLRAYIGAVCRRQALKKIRTINALKRGGKTALIFGELEELCLPDKDISDTLALRDAFNRFLYGLPEQTCRIFLQRYWYMRSVKQIAKDCRKSEDAVKQTLRRTREKLREYLKDEGFEI